MNCFSAFQMTEAEDNGAGGPWEGVLRRAFSAAAGKLVVGPGLARSELRSVHPGCTKARRRGFRNLRGVLVFRVDDRAADRPRAPSREPSVALALVRASGVLERGRGERGAHRGCSGRDPDRARSFSPGNGEAPSPFTPGRSAPGLMGSNFWESPCEAAAASPGRASCSPSFGSPPSPPRPGRFPGAPILRLSPTHSLSRASRRSPSLSPLSRESSTRAQREP